MFLLLNLLCILVPLNNSIKEVKSLKLLDYTVFMNLIKWALVLLFHIIPFQVVRKLLRSKIRFRNEKDVKVMRTIIVYILKYH